jgi:hypothetical protein
VRLELGLRVELGSARFALEVLVLLLLGLALPMDGLCVLH